jgi:hypothetical protein
MTFTSGYRFHCGTLIPMGVKEAFTVRVSIFHGEAIAKSGRAAVRDA